MEKSKTVVPAFSWVQLILNLISGKFSDLKWILIERATQEKRPQIGGVSYLPMRPLPYLPTTVSSLSVRNDTTKDLQTVKDGLDNCGNVFNCSFGAARQVDDKRAFRNTGNLS